MGRYETTKFFNRFRYKWYLRYILICFCRGALPWSGLKAKTTKEKYAKIANKKMEVSLKDLCKGYDQGYAQFIQVCRSVRAGDPVDYNKLRNILKGIAKRKIYNMMVYMIGVNHNLMKKEKKNYYLIHNL